MDFLNSLDLHPPNKKSHRMRSWYMYEQYKSLERNQLDAAQRLKDRVIQDRILSQELNERRARRNLYDRIGLCQSETGIERSSIKTTAAKTDQSSSNDDFFETFCEFQDNSLGQGTNHNKIEDVLSADDLIPDPHFTEDFKSIEEQNESNPDSVTSVVENYKAAGNLSDDTKGGLDLTSIAIDINMQLDAVREDIQCIEQYTRMSDDVESSEGSSYDTIEELENTNCKNTQVKERESNVLAAWSKLVSFAYQVVQLNHGNCYDDYGSQFMTAVLACDVLRRGINCMCHILQPYVSPIKFATDDVDALKCNCNKNGKSKKSVQSRKAFEFKFPPKPRVRRTRKLKCPCRKYHSEDYWPHYSRHSFEDRLNGKKSRQASEPWRSVAMSSDSKKRRKFSSSSIWPDCCKDQECPTLLLSRRECACSPMLKIARYVDTILKDIDDCQYD